MYLIIRAVNVNNTRSNELEHVSDWATSDNPSLNLSKSEKIVFVDKGKKHKFNIPDALDKLKRMQNFKILGIAFTYSLSIKPHVQHLATSNAQTLYVLKFCAPCTHNTQNGNTSSFPFCNFSQAFIHLTSMVGLCWSPRQTKSL